MSAYTVPSSIRPEPPKPKPEYKKYVVAVLLGLLAAVMSLNATYGHFGFKTPQVAIIFLYTWFMFSTTVLQVGLKPLFIAIMGITVGLVIAATLYDLANPWAAAIVPESAYSLFYLFPLTVSLTWLIGIFCPLVLLKNFCEAQSLRSAQDEAEKAARPPAPPTRERYGYTRY